MKLKKIVGINLKYYRYKTGLSQEKFYSGLGLNYKYLARIECGKVNITLEHVEDLAKKLNVTINDLILYDESRVITKKRIDEKQKTNN